MPCALGVKRPALLLALDDLGRQVFPGNTRDVPREAGFANGDDVGHERIEEPGFLCAAAGGGVVAAELAQFFARLDTELDAAVPQHLPGLALVHLGIHVERREQRIERRRRGIHQERFIEALVLDEASLAANMLVALVDLRGLRETRALLVHRLRREQAGHLRPEVLESHRTVIVKQRVKCVVADPRFVPQHVIAQVPDLLQHLAYVIDRAVVGRELDAGQPERALGLVALGVLHHRVLANPLAQGVLVPRVPVDRADHAKRIARGREEDRDRACLHQRTLVQRLVVVPVEQHQVAAAQYRIGDDLVGRRGAIQHEVGPVRAEHLRRMALRIDCGPDMNQQVTEVDVGVAQIVAEDLLAKMLEEQLAGGRLAVELPALVPGQAKETLASAS